MSPSHSFLVAHHRELLAPLSRMMSIRLAPTEYRFVCGTSPCWCSPSRRAAIRWSNEKAFQANRPPGAAEDDRWPTLGLHGRNPDLHVLGAGAARERRASVLPAAVRPSAQPQTYPRTIDFVAAHAAMVNWRCQRSSRAGVPVRAAPGLVTGRSRKPLANRRQVRLQGHRCQSLDAYRTVRSGLPRPPAEGPPAVSPAMTWAWAVRGLGTSRR
jgi:hypothetical protein